MVTPPLLFLAPFVETIFIRPVLLPILSNQVVTEMLLARNVFLLLTPPHLLAPRQNPERNARAKAQQLRGW